MFLGSRTLSIFLTASSRNLHIATFHHIPLVQASHLVKLKIKGLLLDAQNKGWYECGCTGAGWAPWMELGIETSSVDSDI